MKLTKKTKAAILEVYDTWLQSYLNGDVETYDKYLDDAYHFIGSTQNEEFLDRKDTTNFFEATADQLAGKCELRKEQRTLEQFGGVVFVTHLFDAWFLNGTELAYYGRFRFTSALQEKKEGWRFIYQHFSTTDSKAEAGETIGFDQISAENLQLKEAIKRRTFELEAKNRELEIEGALERIRAQAVAMKQSSDLLDIVVTMRDEFTKLGHEAHYFWHMMWLPDKYEKAMTSGDGTRIGFVMELPRHIHGDIALLAKWEKSKKPIFVHAMNAKEAINYVDKMITLGDFQNIDPQAPSHDDIRHIGGLTFIMARTTHGEIGYSLPGVVKHPPAEDLKILEQFAGAFDLAHRRFLDLQKAETQSREVEIELALEKVRSRSMAMHKSEELQEVIQTVYDQFVNLNINIEHTGFIIDYKKNDDMHIWLADKNEVPAEVALPYFDCAHWNSFKDAKKHNKNFFANHLDFKEKNKFYKDLFKLLPDVPQQTSEYYFNAPGLAISTVLLENVGLYIENFDGIPYSDEENDTLVRFGKVFQQTYTRFLDLQKAESQAREAQIEASLERVRSRSMAMQKSEELMEAGALLYKELSELGIEHLTTGYMLFDEKAHIGYSYGVNPADGSIRHLPVAMIHTETKVMKAIVASWKKQQALLVMELDPEETIKHQTFIAERSTNFPLTAAQLLAISPERLIIHCFNFKQGYLLIVGGIRLSDEQQEMVVRFAKVFQQTYTRFLDLQKSEAQAREAQIQLGLERVRARAMAMHKSEELAEAAELLYNQLGELGITAWTCGYVFIDEENDQAKVWMIEPNGKFFWGLWTVPLFEEKVLKARHQSWRKGEKIHRTVLKGKENIAHHKYIVGHSPVSSDAASDFFSRIPVDLVFTSLHFSYGYLLIITEDVLIEEEETVLLRFTEVFQLAYTRFLDLEKAEAQGREAEIELALERVRARTMGMHKSEELAETALVLYEQFSLLGNIPDRMSIGIFKEDSKQLELWPTDQSGSKLNKKFAGSWERSPIMIKIYKAWKAKDNSLVADLSGQDLKEWLKFIREEVKLFVDDSHIKGRRVQQAAFFSHGFLLITTNEPITDEIIQLLIRFAGVFSQTYTRFLDLQKAEAQARESQIQLGLERVRARSMAMHQSEELLGAAEIFSKELIDLGIPHFMSGFVLINESEKKQEVWMGVPESEQRLNFYLPLKGDSILEKRYESWKKAEPLFYQIVEGKALTRHLGLVAEHFQNEEAQGLTETMPNPIIFYCANFKEGYLHILSKVLLNKEQELILTRFTKAFQQTYTRFLDLQKAEAQAREAQIEAALERIRTQALAMRISDDLLEVSKVLREQMRLLGQEELESAIVHIYPAHLDTLEAWYVFRAANDHEGEFVSGKAIVPIKSCWYTRETLKRYNSSEQEYTIISNRKRLAEWYEVLTHVAPDTVDRDKDGKLIVPEILYYHYSKFSGGALLMISNEQPSTEAKELQLRAALVFDLAFRRFLDLQKAEEQTREAQINLAVERVRAKALAMHRSEEIMEVVAKLKDEVLSLDIPDVIAATIFLRAADNQVRMWDLSSLEKLEDVYQMPLDITFKIKKSDPHLYVKRVWENKTDYFVEKQDEKGFKRLLGFFREHGKNEGADEIEAYIKSEKLTRLYHAAKKLNNGKLVIDLLDPPSEEIETILTKMGAAFDLAYKRFEDLQKAEGQTREAQIEAALEKLRARSMAMQKSDELAEAARTLYKELYKLGITNFVTCGFVELDENSKFQQGWVTLPDGDLAEGFKLPLKGDPILNKRFKAWKKQDKLFYQSVGGKELRKHLAYVNPTFESKQIETMVRENFPDPTLFYCWNFGQGYLHIITDKKFEEKETQIISRFARVFEQTYTRFLDLKKAEAQARESQIEAAMERIRSRAIAMRSSDELLEVALEIQIQTDFLGQQDLEASVVHLYKKNTPFFESMAAVRTPGDEGKITTHRLQFPVDATLEIEQMMENYWAGRSQYTIELNRKQRKRWEKILEKYAPEIFRQRLQIDADDLAVDRKEYWNFADFSGGSLLTVTHAPPSPDTNELFKRCADVFDLAYKRYKDLQKAEAQAREAQIEAALERVRGRALAMHQSDELLAVIQVVSEQLLQLNLSFDTVSFGKNSQEGDFKFWLTSSGQPKPVLIEVPFLDSRVLNTVVTAQKKRTDFIADVFSPIETRAWSEHLIKFSDLKLFPEKVKQFILNSPGFARSSFLMEHIDLYVGNYRATPFTAAENSIFKRFAQVFAQAYTRFLDLQKAEAQVREAQIEAALEKVRSRSLAMRQSPELLDVITEICLQLEVLDITLDSCFINIYKDGNLKDLTMYIAAGGRTYKEAVFVPFINNPLFTKLLKARKNNDNFYSIVLDKKQTLAWWKQFFPNATNIDVPRKRKNYISKSSGIATSVSLGKYASIHMMRYTPIPYVEEENQILMRFGKVFDQVYTRFLDLQRAEAQAREAQIEAALERVRSKAMAMRSSEDIGEATTILFKEIKKLELESMRCGILIIHDTKVMDVWTSTTKDDEIVRVTGQIDMTIHPLFKNVYRSWKAKESHTEYVLEGKDGEKYYQALSKEAHYKLPSSSIVKDRHYNTCFIFNEGALFAFTKHEIPETALIIFKRFAKVFGLTYQRYRELIESEKREREAIKKSSLDRVRAEIASMRTSADLERITPLIWKELKILGVPFFRCGVFIMDEAEQIVHTYLSTPSGKSLAAMKIHMSSDIPIIKDSYANWKLQKPFYENLDKNQFEALTHALLEQGFIKNPKSYQGGDKAPENLVLHMANFKQGMLYVGNDSKLSNNQFESVKSLAEAFEVAYARYEDFNKLEISKLKTEQTLKELKQTQQQLVQSEKMASLGELTAGIAHEIQNPLNFVNNFSEVSKELLEEMMEEMTNGDLKEVRAIANDIIQNLDKINHHGKRADGIVKGMLQHSRSSTGKKEPTDINTLADEYLRLAYHGLRAKDKSFNATLETDFGDAIGKINIIPQDMGRVILNLITNAFYACTERKKTSGDPAFKPTVSVKTKQVANNVMISVKDNGNGIPKHVIDKIFQPFFTTKPTGKGTGLGLSMSYDIITKGHGGELKVETKEGEGSEFTILLPF